MLWLCLMLPENNLACISSKFKCVDFQNQNQNQRIRASGAIFHREERVNIDQIKEGATIDRESSFP